MGQSAARPPLSGPILVSLVFALVVSHLRISCQEAGPKCYDSPEDLFHITPLQNSTFRLRIKEKCLESSREVVLFAFDVSIADTIKIAEIEQLDQDKLNMIRIHRQTRKFGRAELTHFNMDSKFKLAVAFFDATGMVDIAIQSKVFSFSPESSSSTSTEIVLIAFLGVLLVITCILLAILIYINYFGSGQLQSYLIFWRKEDNRKLIKARLSVDDDIYPQSSFVPRSNVIPVGDLLSLVPSMLDGDAVKNEYNYVPKSQLFSWNQSKLPEHKTKNRYGNLLPYDHSRVVLKKESPGETDYMNANLIDGYKKTGRYIAMQGPIDATIEDFWRCVWQFKVQQIVMLTNLEESGKSKCDKYWPDMSHFYATIKVSLQKTELFADYTIRHFHLEKENESRAVVQYHFLSWPDHMVPMYACSLISFVNCIRSTPLYHEDSPMIVHCSAGIGRTGAFIVIDSMLRMAEKEKKIDVFGHFCKIRQQRFNMVEKYAQYRFVYQVLLEALSHDPTDISCTDFAGYLERQTKGGEKVCPLHKQFEILNTMSVNKLAPEVCKFGLANFQFNRRQDVVPPDYARVILPNLNDYINAVYVNGYRKQDAYIATQVPFENNRVQFWRMIENTQANLIVLLNELSADEQYWSSAVNQRMSLDDELSVTLQKEDISNNITVRTFVLKPAEVTVKQVQLRGFLTNFTKSASSHSLIELKEKLDTHALGATSVPLVVQCTDGVQLCGLFCAADFIFERIKEEQQIDAFLAVQKVRTNRPQFVTSYEQYLYLHQVALAYLKSFDHYANFK